MIESYEFGKIDVNGVEYSSDIIIYNNYVLSQWRRKKGHELCVADIKNAVEQFKPSTVVIGTGKMGMMKILSETEYYFETLDIKFIADKTDNACLKYNELSLSNNVLCALHLTC